MYGNEGEAWVMVKALNIGGLSLDRVGEEYKIAPYHYVPHGYASIEHEMILIYIPDRIFEEHFVGKKVYEQYVGLGDRIKINANGNLGTYVIENITGDGHYATLQMKRE